MTQSYENPDGSFANEAGGLPVTIVAPLSGATVAMKTRDRALYVNAAGTLATLTVKLPLMTAVNHGEMVWVATKNAVTALTVQDGFGNAVSGAPATLAAGSVMLMRYLKTTQNNIGWVVAGAVSFASVILSGLLYESAGDTITAHAGGGQASATALTAELNRVTTVATVGDSVKLPASVAGLTIIVANHGANAMQVFGAGTDTIDDVASATGVSQMKNSVVIYSCYTAGAWYTEGLATGYTGTGLQTLAFADNITAAGTTQGTATPLTAAINTVATVASGTGVNLPASAPGLDVTIINNGANGLLVYPAQGASDTINGVAAANGILMLPGSTFNFNCTAAGAWTAMPATTQHTAYNAANNAASFTATAAQISGGDVFVELDLTGNPAGAANVTLPTVANLVLALHSPTVGTSFTLRIKNSANTNTWTVVTNTGWTLAGTVTIATGTWRDFQVKLTSLSAATLQNMGGGATL